MSAIAATRPKLPVVETISLSYRLGLRHMGAAVLAGWLVLSASGVIAFVTSWLVFPHEKASGSVGLSWISLLLLPALSLAFTAMIAVPWHRLILTGEPISSPRVRPSRDAAVYWIWAVGMMTNSDPAVAASLGLRGAVARR